MRKLSENLKTKLLKIIWIDIFFVLGFTSYAYKCDSICGKKF